MVSLLGQKVSGTKVSGWITNNMAKVTIERRLEIDVWQYGIEEDGSDGQNNNKILFINRLNLVNNTVNNMSLF